MSLKHISRGIRSFSYNLQFVGSGEYRLWKDKWIVDSALCLLFPSCLEVSSCHSISAASTSTSVSKVSIPIKHGSFGSR